MSRELVYVISPYTHKDPLIRIQRYYNVMGFINARQIEDMETTVYYSPIVHWHPVATTFNLPYTFDHWKEINKAMIERSDWIAYVKISGHEISNGCEDDTRMAIDAGKTIRYFDAATFQELA